MIPSNHWSRQQKAVAPDTQTIVEYLRDGTAFSAWDDNAKRVFAVAAFPTELKDAKGRWTVEGRHALNMLRHLFQRETGGSFLTAPESIRDIADKLSAEERLSVALQAFNVRMELPLVTPPWIAGDLFTR